MTSARVRNEYAEELYPTFKQQAENMVQIGRLIGLTKKDCILIFLMMLKKWQHEKTVTISA